MRHASFRFPMQHRLNFRPDPHGHGALRPIPRYMGTVGFRVALRGVALRSVVSILVVSTVRSPLAR
jgi:hypothetical protein